MSCLTLLFIVILTIVSKVTSLHCSDQQLPASGDDHLQQVTTLQYCLVDDCTIMKINTGEKLDIVYTTDSLIVTIPTDGHTSEVIARLDNELPCLEPTNMADDHRLQIVAEIVILLLIQLLCWYIIAIHIIFKELRTLFGKLLMLYNIAVVLCSIGFTSRFLLLFQIVPNSLLLCYPSALILNVPVVTVEALCTCILHHIAATMRRCYKLRSQMSKEASQRHFRWYIVYSLGTTLFALLMYICFDVATGNYKDTLLPNGQCVSIEIRIYGTLIIPTIFNGISKVAQIVQFIAYLYNTNKLNKYVNNTGVSNEYLSLLHKTAVALGAMIGFNQFAFFTQTILNHDIEALISVSIGLFLAQQCIMVAILMFTRKVRRLCRERFSKE